jgi:L-fucose mutarotase/ribose pyranase (RbsD/FucU family)
VCAAQTSGMTLADSTAPAFRMALPVLRMDCTLVEGIQTVLLVFDTCCMEWVVAAADWVAAAGAEEVVARARQAVQQEDPVLHSSLRLAS